MNPLYRCTIEIAALLAIGAGLWQVSPPACSIVIGALVLASSILGRIRGN